MTSAVAFDEVLGTLPIPPGRSSVIAPVATARLNARTCAPRLHRLVRFGVVCLGVLHYLLLHLLTSMESES